MKVKMCPDCGVEMDYGYETWWCDRCEKRDRKYGIYPQDKLIGAYFLLWNELIKLPTELNDSAEAEAIRDEMDFIWDKKMTEETRGHCQRITKAVAMFESLHLDS